MDKKDNELEVRTITIYKNTFDSKNPFHIDVTKALDRIKNGHSKELVENLRKIPITNEHKEERSTLKKKLPAYSFSGKFKWRANDAIQESSGLICLDFDHLENYDKWTEALKKDKYTYAFFRSPSGDGIKVLIKIPEVIEDFKNYFEALRMYFKMDDFEGWDDLKDISRLCYESYDPNLFVNDDSKVFDIMIKEKPVVTEFSKDGTKLSDRREVYRRVKAWADRTNDYGDGNKHKFLVYIASACNRFGLEMDFVIENLVEDYQHRASPVDSGDFREIVKRVYITYANQHANSFFTQEGEMSDFDPESPARDVVYLSDIRDAMVKSYLTGDAKGETTYFNSIDPHWRWKKGEVNIMHGIPNHGKCEFIDSQVLMADGSYKKAGDIKVGDKVVSFDNNHKQVEDEVVAFELTGDKEVFELRLSCGFSIECTKEHQIYTSGGWKRLEEIEVGDYVCTPRKLDFENYQSHVTHADAALLATWLTEGSKSNKKTKHYRFYNGSEEFVKNLNEHISISGLTTTRSSVEDISYSIKVSDNKISPGDVLKKYGVSECKTNSIFIPHQLLTAPIDVVSTFISTLINCDGCVTYHGIEYTSNSRQMCFDLCMLLRRYGCVAILNKKKSSYKREDGTKFKSTTWRVMIKSATQAKKLLPHLKLISYKQEALGDFCDVQFEKENIDVFPSHLREQHFSFGQKHYKKQLGVYLKNGAEGRKCSIHTSKATAVLEHENNEVELQRLKAYSYNKVLSIKSKGIKPTCDMETKRWHNFISDGIVTHNSTLMFQLMLIKSVKEGKKWGVFSPEQNPPIDFYKDLIHMYIGQSTEHYHPNQMSLADYNRGIDFMMEHFYFVYPKDDTPTPRYINDRFEELIIKHGIKGCMTDPFNQLDNDWSSAGGRDDQYIGTYLSGEKRFALDHDVYKIIVCHPKGNIEKVTDRNQTDDLMNAGNHQIPDQYNLAGGAMWSNKVDNLLATYQPYYLSRLRARRSQGNEAHFDTFRHPGLVQFVSQKIKKQKLIGRPGTANLIYNIETARYHEEKIDYDYDDPSIDAKEIYTPFNKEYVHHESMSNPETQVSENDWSAFQQQEEERVSSESSEREEKESHQIEEELGLDMNDWDPSDFEDYDSFGEG